MTSKLTLLMLGLLLLSTACGREGPPAAEGTTVASTVHRVSTSPLGKEGTNCRSTETVEFSCAFAGKIASACSTVEEITFRYGPMGKPEVEIASDGTDGRVHQVAMPGGRSNTQDHLRFSQDGLNYIVYSGTAGQFAARPGEQYSGLSLDKDKVLVFDHDCPDRGRQKDIELSRLPRFIPRNEDEHFDIFY